MELKNISNETVKVRTESGTVEISPGQRTNVEKPENLRELRGKVKVGQTLND